MRLGSKEEGGLKKKFRLEQAVAKWESELD